MVVVSGGNLEEQARVIDEAFDVIHQGENRDELVSKGGRWDIAIKDGYELHSGRGASKTHIPHVDNLPFIDVAGSKKAVYPSLQRVLAHEFAHAVLGYGGRSSEARALGEAKSLNFENRFAGDGMTRVLWNGSLMGWLNPQREGVYPTIQR